jgi:hypothetical protein
MSSAKPQLDYSLIPGSKVEQSRGANLLLRKGIKPISIEKNGSKWRITVLGTDIGNLRTKEEARSVAYMIGEYKLGLGPFVDTYTEGY